VNKESIAAKYEDGILEIQVEKPEEKKVEEKEINVEIK